MKKLVAVLLAVLMVSMLFAYDFQISSGVTPVAFFSIGNKEFYGKFGGYLNSYFLFDDQSSVTAAGELIRTEKDDLFYSLDLYYEYDINPVYLRSCATVKGCNGQDGQTVDLLVVAGCCDFMVPNKLWYDLNAGAGIAYQSEIEKTGFAATYFGELAYRCSRNWYVDCTFKGDVEKFKSEKPQFYTTFSVGCTYCYWD